MIYINIFFVYSFIGFIYESIVNYISDGIFESGFLYGPITPIYGIGVLVITFIYNKFKNKYNKVNSIIISSIISSIVLTIIEYISGMLLQIFFSKIYWDYSSFKFSFNKYIALEVSVIWLILSAFVILTFEKILNLIKKIPRYVSYILIFIFICDVIISFIHLL